MRRLLATYKQFLFGLAAGAGTMCCVVWMSSSATEPFQQIPYVIRNVDGNTLVKTPKFSVLYRGVNGPNAAGSMTVSGRNNGLSSLWNGGASSGYGASAEGIDSMTLYDESFGIATIFVAGQVMRISNSGSKLHVADTVFDMSQVAPFIVVDENKRARSVSGDSKEAIAFLNAVDTEYYTTAPAAMPDAKPAISH
jgi:hypothetical protein